MARSRRRGRAASSDHTVIFVVGGAVIAVLLFIVVFGPKIGLFGDDKNENRGRELSTDNYLKKGSSSVSRNTFSFEATVDSIKTKGKARLVQVSTTEDNKRIPLFVPADASLSSNINENSSYLFTVKGCNGTTSQGEEVKGVLIIIDAEPK